MLDFQFGGVIINMTKEIKITLNNGDYEHINPVLNFTIFNGFYEYDYKPEDIKSIEIYEIKDSENE